LKSDYSNLRQHYDPTPSRSRPHSLTSSHHIGLRCFLLNRRLALAGFGAGISVSWSAKLGAKIGRSTLLPAILVWSLGTTLSVCICRVKSRKDRRCDELPSGLVELLTSTRRVRWRLSGGLCCSLRNGLSAKMRRRNRGMAVG
jgi:hypothetical protein